MPDHRTRALILVAAGALAATPAMAAPTVLTAALSGSEETPPVAMGGTGSFHARIDPAKGELCYTLASNNLDTPTMAHIHAGTMGVAGPPVVTLSTSAPAETCIAVDEAVAAKLVASPGDYYVNIHTARYPGGAVRGQLAK